MRISRRTQFYTLIALTAITTLAQYVVQGVMAGGVGPGEIVSRFGSGFWTVDASLWALRALVESGVVAFLFSTDGRSRSEKALLALLEVSLLAVIGITVGLAFRAVGYGSAMLVSLGEPWFTLWTGGIAAYTPLMMGAAGVAYRVQPGEQQRGTGAGSRGGATGATGQQGTGAGSTAAIAPVAAVPATSIPVICWCGRVMVSGKALAGHHREHAEEARAFGSEQAAWDWITSQYAQEWADWQVREQQSERWKAGRAAWPGREDVARWQAK